MKERDTVYRKWMSRTWWLAVLWTSFIPLGFVFQFLMEVELPLAALIWSAGLIAGAYVGGEKLVDSMRKKRGE